MSGTKPVSQMPSNNSLGLYGLQCHRWMRWVIRKRLLSPNPSLPLGGLVRQLEVISRPPCIKPRNTPDNKTGDGDEGEEVRITRTPIQLTRVSESRCD